VSLLVVDGDDATAVAASLASAAAQLLPPIEAIVLAARSAELDYVLGQDWPFTVIQLDTVPKDGWRALRHVLGASHGELLAFLNAGDQWTETALDRHRRAFSSSLNRVAFSYGGCADEAQAATPLDNDPTHRIHQMIVHWVPGSLSAMVIDRRALAQLPTLPLPADCPLWLAIASRLTLECPGVAVRLRTPAIAHGGQQTRNPEAATGLLTTLIETRPGMRVAGLAERVQADPSARNAPRARLDAPESQEPT
jgi:hypothetical protein